MPDDTPEPLRIGQAAAVLGVSVDTVRRWEEEGRLDVVRSEGGQRLVPMAEVRRLLDERPRRRHRIAATSARNQLEAIVTEVVADAAAATVEMQAGPYRLVALTTAESVRELALAPGDRVLATVKATSVMVALPEELDAMARATRVLAGLLLLGGLLPACATGTTEARGDGDTMTGELTVLAAASLTDAFTELGEVFETTHPGARVRFAFAGSQQLATQVLEGAPADVFASADPTQMAVVADADAADDPVAFAGNRLAIAVEPGNPLDLRGVADLADPGLAVVLAAEEVPAGRYTRQLLDTAGVQVRPDSLEADVRAVLSRVALGEADAGVVYASDVAAAGGVELVEVPAADNVTATYEISVLTRAGAPALARAFVDVVRSQAGQEVLVAHGFTGAP